MASSATNQDTLPNSVFKMSQLDIPSYNSQGYGNDGSNENSSVHTTPLNYMRSSRGNLRGIEKIQENDSYTGLHQEKERSLDAQFDMINLSSEAEGSFFQLEGKEGQALEELEPTTGELPGQQRHTDDYFLSSNDTTQRFGNRGAEQQHFDGEGYTGYGQTYAQDHLSSRQDGHGSSQQGHSSYLVVPPSVNISSANSYSDGGNEYTANLAPYHQSAPRPHFSAATPRESWSTSTQRVPVPHSAQYGTQQLPLPSQYPGQMPPRRVGPASPSMLSSYATASAQPQLSKYIQPNPAPVPGAYGDYRALMRDDLARYPAADRSAYPVQGGMRPSGGMGMGGMPPQAGYYGAAPQPYGAMPRPAPYPAPQAGAYYSSQPVAPVQPDLIFQVQFKRTTKCFTNRSGHQIQERDFVVVEGDRGEDIGVVIAILTMQEFVHRRMSDPRAAADNHTVDCILRLATMQERQQLPEKYNAEKNIVQSCNELAMHGFGLPIFVYDAEFQFDRNKLTIYYECNVRIDFRDFVRQLYSTYKARIWMKIGNMNTPIDVQPLAVMALATGVHFSNGGAVA